MMTDARRARARPQALGETPPAPKTAEIRWQDERVVVVGGRTLRLILWLALRQERINALSAARGQLWLSWKGEGADSIAGDLRTVL